MKKNFVLLYLFMLITVLFAACKKDGSQEPELQKPTASNIEIGTGNNKRGIIGADFHLNADIIAGNQIENVKVVISQKSTETYAASWKFELLWESYKGAKNTTVHKHFTIPLDAPKGKYDFFLIVTDINGTKLEIKEDFNIIAKADLAFNPTFTFNKATPKENQVFKKGAFITAYFSVNDVKGEGSLTAVLIKETAKHNPETVSSINLEKAISFGKSVTSIEPGFGMYNTIAVGAETDMNGSPIKGEKSWESGKYNFVMLYENKGYGISIYKSIPIVIDYN
ncbi:DUF4625 domain-containing protein [Pedobacter mucosus]|uniref:DUF4625 domain-containing protein n=1 Tax=Pedobacter mucosus TaxID=2895286 RepID=UPI001EE4A24F|nr:DUF4625 domain-containing protein [Pedobacter mucosus]UKT64267.1 DUF4625 domain-containing protein [Pedobacter mucosus]